MPCLFEDKDRPPPCQGVFRRRLFRVGPSVLSRHLPTLDGSTERFDRAHRPEPFGPESFDPELKTEGLTAEGHIEGLAEVFGRRTSDLF